MLLRTDWRKVSALFQIGNALKPAIAALVAAIMAGLFISAPVQAAQLVMFEEEYCEWCEMWREEVGTVYDRTDEGRVAPLRTVDIHDARPGDLTHIKRIHYTPTFVILEEGREIGRILGYPGEDMFYGMLGEILKRLDKPSG